MTVVLTARSELRDDGVHTTYSIDGDEIGTLITEVGEWQLIGAALILGAEQTRGDLVVVNEGDAEVVQGLSAQARDDGTR